MEGRTALITGAGSGVGRAVAIALGRSGCHLLLVGRREQKLIETRELVMTEGGTQDATIHIAALDATDLDGVRRLSQSDVARNVDILVNNAGAHGGHGRITESDPEQWSTVLSTNVIGPYYLTRFFVPGMKQREWGRVVNVSSAASFGAPRSAGSAYALSKVALNRFTRQLAEELEGTGVTANAIHPGEVKTEMWRAIKDDAESRGAEGKPFLNWTDMVEQTGGDPPEAAAALVMEICAGRYSETNGQFLWIEGKDRQTPADW